jgi:hypothetical protein
MPKGYDTPHPRDLRALFGPPLADAVAPLCDDVRDAVAEELTAHLRRMFARDACGMPPKLSPLAMRLEMGRFLTERYPRLSGSWPARPGPQRSLRSEAESSGVPALPNVKTARSWRGIVPLRTSHGRGV